MNYADVTPIADENVIDPGAPVRYDAKHALSSGMHEGIQTVAKYGIIAGITLLAAHLLLSDRAKRKIMRNFV